MLSAAYCTQELLILPTRKEFQELAKLRPKESLNK